MYKHQEKIATKLSLNVFKYVGEISHIHLLNKDLFMDKRHDVPVGSSMLGNGKLLTYMEHLHPAGEMLAAAQALLYLICLHQKSVGSAIITPILWVRKLTNDVKPDHKA